MLHFLILVTEVEGYPRLFEMLERPRGRLNRTCCILQGLAGFSLCLFVFGIAYISSLYAVLVKNSVVLFGQLVVFSLELCYLFIFLLLALLDTLDPLL